MDLIKFDFLKHKKPSGVVVKGENVEFKINVKNVDLSFNVTLNIKEDSEKEYENIKMTRQEDCFVVVKNFKNSGHYFYNFKITQFGEEYFLNKSEDYLSYLSKEKGEDFVQIVTEENYECFDSLQGGIIYQIMIDRFCKVGEVKARKQLFLRDDWGGNIKKYFTDSVKINEQVFGGNINGVISKLDYLENLGVTAIYFTPINLANSHHKYDTADYLKIDEMFGTEEDFKNLIDKAKQKNIKIIIDGVYNHTGSDSVYFNKNKNFGDGGAFNTKNSKYFEWYDFYNYPNEYNCWWGIKTLPSIKKDNLDYQNFIAGNGGVIEKFLKLGVFGIRLDVVDELTDEFVKKISNKIKSFNENFVCMGEVWEDASTKIGYGKRRKYFTNNELNSVMNYPLKNAILDYIFSKSTQKLNCVIKMLLCQYPKPVLDNLLNPLGTHDTHRIFSEIKKSLEIDDFDLDLKTSEIYFNKDESSFNNKWLTDKNKTDFIADDKQSDNKNQNVKMKLSEEDKNKINEKFNKAIKLLKIAYVLNFTLMGVPSIFYGDEYGAVDSDENSRVCFDWKNYQNDIYFFVKKLTKIRKMSVFKNGETNILLSEEGKFVFERFNEFEQIVIMTNLNKTPLSVNLKGEFVSFFSGEKKDATILSENEFEILISKNNLGEIKI